MMGTTSGWLVGEGGPANTVGNNLLLRACQYHTLLNLEFPLPKYVVLLIFD